jgi:hypothetical protein
LLVDQLAVLADLVRELDAPTLRFDEESDMFGTVNGDPEVRVARFVRVMHWSAGPGSHLANAPTTAIEATAADSIVAGCELIGRLAEHFPSIARGPVDRSEQLRVENSRSPTSSELPAVHVDGNGTVRGRVGTAPAGAQYSSTRYCGTWSPWRTYLELNRGSTLYPIPWHTWRIAVEDEARIAEIDCAASWVRLLGDHPHAVGGELVPDWGSIAEDYDGVHLSFAGVLPIQGRRFTTRHGVTAPVYWDVESTVWLRPVVTRADLIDVDDAVD